MLSSNKELIAPFGVLVSKQNNTVGLRISETASIAYDGTLLPTGTASYAGISIDATKRYLKNSGRDKTPALVESGQGKFFNGTSQYLNTGIIPNQAQGTLVTRFTYVTGQVSRCSIGTVSLSIWVNASGKIEGQFGDVLVTSTDVLVNGLSYHVSLSWVGLVATLKVNYVTKATNTATAFNPTNVMYIGARNNVGTADRYFNNVIDETYYYDIALSDSQIQSLYLYPEKVKSYNGAIVPDIGSEANCKLFMPLCENSGSNVYNVAINPATSIALVNYTTAMHTSAAKLSYGAQCTAWKRDSLGMLLGMSNGLSFDGGVSVKGVSTGWTPVNTEPFVIESVVKVSNGVLNQAFGTGYLANSTTGMGFTSAGYPQGFIADKYINNSTVMTVAHVVVMWNGTVGQSKVYINGAEMSYVKETSYVNPATPFYIGSLGTTQKSIIAGTPKIYKGAQYAKFDIAKSWAKAQKIIAKLGA